ncbi:hypothetical protein COV18_04310 [Candidatus Woesearchaeota archaeon CG10_big_fil_rev_8_21_14_0_10_37_12]|nr:MAG: hypothetical protein COV18_04310 [Candidatus Woesearchaeota archaeon CG10_big_fil_rev_8_21_14_0_10_37_12]
MINENKKVQITYTNYKGETSQRNIIPLRLIFSSNEWHKEEQWLLEAYDLVKQANRTFSCKDIREWD